MDSDKTFRSYNPFYNNNNNNNNSNKTKMRTIVCVGVTNNQYLTFLL